MKNGTIPGISKTAGRPQGPDLGFQIIILSAGNLSASAALFPAAESFN